MNLDTKLLNHQNRVYITSVGKDEFTYKHRDISGLYTVRYDHVERIKGVKI